MSVVTQPMNAEAFGQLPENGMRHELINGKVVHTLLPNDVHGSVLAIHVVMLLYTWLKHHGQGYVGTESGFVLRRNPDTVRRLNVYFVRAERIPASGVPDGFWDIAPDLAIEIVTPSTTAENVRGKVSAFLLAGTQMVWEVYPRWHEVVVHLPDGSGRRYGEQATLTAPAILPGFSCTVAALFG